MNLRQRARPPAYGVPSAFVFEQTYTNPIYVPSPSSGSLYEPGYMSLTPVFDPDVLGTVELVELVELVTTAELDPELVLLVAVFGAVLVEATLVGAVLAGTVTVVVATGAALHPAMVNPEQSLFNKFLTRPNSLWSIDKPQRALTEIQSPRYEHQ